MKHWLTYTGKFTAVYIIMYLLLNSVFVHTHLIDGKLVTHSHPFTANQHTAGEASIIKTFNNSLGIAQNQTQVPELECKAFTPYKSEYVNLYRYNYSYFKPFRGPPFS